MATALDIAKRAMRLLGALGDGETPTASEGADVLAALNALLDSWWSNTLAVYHTRTESFSWAGGQVSQTMGPGGDFATTRPARIESMFQREGGIDYPIRVMPRAEYDSIADKTTQSTHIERVYVEATVPLVTLYAHPVPSLTVEVHIQSLARLQAFAALSDDMELPPGYERALAYNLALEIAPEFDVEVPPLVMRNAATSLRSIKRANLAIEPAVIEPGLMHGSRFNIWSGE